MRGFACPTTGHRHRFVGCQLVEGEMFRKGWLFPLEVLYQAGSIGKGTTSDPSIAYNGQRTMRGEAAKGSNCDTGKIGLQLILG